jgi:hypothetical protein
MTRSQIRGDDGARGTALRAAEIACRLLWASPCSALGAVLGCAVIAAGGSARRVGRTVEIARYHWAAPPGSRLARAPFAAITFGHVILGASHAELARLRPHEQVHVRQYERLGPLFLVAYPCSSLLALLRGECPYRANRFEQQAFRETDAGDTWQTIATGEHAAMRK